MSLEQVERLFAQVKDSGAKLVGLEGDHSQIEDVIDIGHKAGVGFSVSVSPPYLDEGLAERAMGKVRGFTISLDGGTPETNDRIRNCPGTFEKTMRVLEFLKSRGIGHSVFCALSNFNKDEIDLIADKVRGGPKEIIFIYTSNFGRAVKEMTITKDDWRDVTAKLEALKKSGAGPKIIYEPVFCEKGEPGYADYEPCSLYSRKMCFIDCEGNVYFCPLLAGREGCRFALGNIFKEDFSKIWGGSPKWEEFRKLNEEMTGKCDSCSALGKCVRGCFANTIVHGRQMPEGVCSKDTMPMCYMYWYGLFE